MFELIYKDLSYQINGIAFKIDNLLGFGQSEKTYFNMLKKLLEKNNIAFEREKYLPIRVDREIVAKKYFDFIIDNKIIVKAKIGTKDYCTVYSQIFHYLKMSKLKLGLIIRFTKDGVKVKRIPNIKN